MAFPFCFEWNCKKWSNRNGLTADWQKHHIIFWRHIFGFHYFRLSIVWLGGWRMQIFKPNFWQWVLSKLWCSIEILFHKLLMKFVLFQGSLNTTDFIAFSAAHWSDTPTTIIHTNYFEINWWLPSERSMIDISRSMKLILEALIIHRVVGLRFNHRSIVGHSEHRSDYMV